MSELIDTGSQNVPQPGGVPACRPVRRRHHLMDEPRSDDMAWIEWPRWLRFLAFTAAVMALIATIVALGVATVLLVS